MKILHTSDWHLGKSLYDFPLLDDQAHFIRWLVSLLEEQAVDAVIIAGDIYDRPVPPGSAVELYDHFLSEAVGRLGIPVLAIAGNHDSPARLQFGSSLYRKSGYYIVGSVESGVPPVSLQDQYGPIHFTLLPYLHVADARTLFPEKKIRTFDDAYRALLESLRPLPDGRNIGVAHGFFSNLGGQADPLLTSDSEIGIGGMDLVDSACFAGFDYVALGHLHAPQRAGESVRYSGSPLKYSLSEERQKKSVTLVEMGAAGTPPQISVIPVPALRDVRTVCGTMEELLEPSFHKDKQFGDYVFADVRGEECLYPMQKLRTLFPHLLGLRFSGLMEQVSNAPLPQAGQAVSGLSTRELFQRFFADSAGYPIPEQYLEIVDEILEQAEKEGDN